MTPSHHPALCREVVEWLQPRPGKVMVDATVGLGGHAEALLERLLPGGRLIGFDCDPQSLHWAAQRLARFGEAVVLRRGRFSDLRKHLEEMGIEGVDGLLADLGLSEWQIRSPRFSFQAEGPLDMRMDPDLPRTAADVLADASEEELTEWLRRYGEEPMARAIAREILRRRRRAPLRTNRDLVEAILRAVPPSRRPRRKHVATRTFQALRIVVNREMEELEALLAQIPEVLRPAGRVAILSYHSLEDRRVKQFFRREAQGCLCPPHFPVCRCQRVPRLRVLTPHPIRPSAEEVRAHPTARSARLRVAERLEGRPAPRREEHGNAPASLP